MKIHIGTSKDRARKIGQSLWKRGKNTNFKRLSDINSWRVLEDKWLQKHYYESCRSFILLVCDIWSKKSQLGTNLIHEVRENDSQYSGDWSSMEKGERYILNKKGNEAVLKLWLIDKSNWMTCCVWKRGSPGLHSRYLCINRH